MSLFGKALAVLNLVALLAFFYLATASFQMRQAWSYAVLRWDVALDGLPIDTRDVDDRGRPRYLNMNDALCSEMVGNPKLNTQEAFLDARTQELLGRVEDGDVKGSKVAKFVELLLPFCNTAGEREDLMRSLREKDQEPRFRTDVVKILDGYLDLARKLTYEEARKQSFAGNLIRAIAETSSDSKARLDERLEKVQEKPLPEQGAEVAKALLDTVREMQPLDAGKTLLAAHVDVIKNAPDRGAKRLGLAHLLAGLVDVLPTEKEKEDMAEDAKKPADQRAGPVAMIGYRRTLNAVGVRTMARALDLQAQELLAMDVAVTEGRLQERTNFLYHHQSLVQHLFTRELELQEEKEKLVLTIAQAKKQKERADSQVAEVARLEGDLVKSRERTAKALDDLAAQQDRLYLKRLELRGANARNQLLEQAIRTLEAKVEAEKENR